MEESGDFLIVGLGNPGVQYERTRHNFGFMVVETLAKRHSLMFKKAGRIAGKVASGHIANKKVHLLLPTTFMNLCGAAVNQALHFYKIRREHILAAVDDIYIPFGSMRLRSAGGAGGHNGLKSIDSSIGTQSYCRLRLGVGAAVASTNTPSVDLSSYVLAPFSQSESLELAQLAEKGALVIEEWLKLGVDAASQLAGNLSKLGNQ